MGFISSLFGDNQKINIGNLESDINQALEPAMAGYKNLRLKVLICRIETLHLTLVW